MTYILAATEQTALKLATAIASGSIPPMAADLASAEALRASHPAPLAYGLAIWVAKIENGRPGAVSVDLASPSKLSQMGLKRMAPSAAPRIEFCPGRARS